MKKIKKESVSLAAAAPKLPHQRKEPSRAEDYSDLLGLAGSPTGRKAARSLAGKAYKSQATPPSPPPHERCVRGNVE